MARRTRPGDLGPMNDDLKLQHLRGLLGDGEWVRRIAAADHQAAVLERVLDRHRAGESKRAAIRVEAPGDPETTWVARLKRYEANGRDELIARNLPVQGEVKLTPEVVGLLRGLLHGAPTMRSPEVRENLESVTGTSFSETTVRRGMRRAGVAQPSGRPSQEEVVEVHPLAGAELLRAVDLEVGATRHMALGLRAHMESLPPPRGALRDDSGHRDELGRFLSSYNEPKERTVPELGEKFNSVEVKRAGKALPLMQVANSSLAVLHRKIETLTFTPVVTDSPRLAGLHHRRGDLLCRRPGGSPTMAPDAIRGSARYSGCGPDGRPWRRGPLPTNRGRVRPQEVLMSENWQQTVDIGNVRITYNRDDGARVSEDGAGAWRAVKPAAGSGWVEVLGHYGSAEEAKEALEMGEK